MSDKSRRRKPRNSGDSEKLSEDSYEDIVKGSEEVRKTLIYLVCGYLLLIESSVTPHDDLVH